MEYTPYSKIYAVSKNDIMPVEKFKGHGLGTKKDTRPISAKFSPDVDAFLRSLADRSAYIRQAVEEKMRKDGVIE